MDNLTLLLKQLEEQNKIIKWCQTLLTIAVVVCIVAIVIMLFIIFKGKGYFSKDEVIIGDVKDKNELHKEVVELRRIVERLEKNQKIRENIKINS